MIGPAFGRAVARGDLAVAITGAGGWLGQAMLHHWAAEAVWPRRLRLFGSTDRSDVVGGRTLAVERLRDAQPLDGGPWLLLHFAALGMEHTRDMDAASFTAANDAILHDVLRLAEPCSRLRFVFASSGAAYDPDASPYGRGKVAHERAIAAWCSVRGAPLVIPRIFNIGGPCINKHGSYALSAMLLAARRADAIRITAPHPVFRSYVHVDELNGLLCEAALDATAGAIMRFDTAGRETVEMADLAAAIALAMRPRAVRIERAGPPTGPPTGLADWYVGDGRQYRALLAHAGQRVVGLNRIIGDTAAFLSA